jgi:hypothetical protein
LGAANTFLLSPAYCGGRRAQILLREGAASPLAVELRAGRLTLGDAFAFLSGLYFRGKLTYARAFTSGRPAAPPPVLVITPTRGLQRPDTPVTIDLLREFAAVDVSANDARYREPLERRARRHEPRRPAAPERAGRRRARLHRGRRDREAARAAAAETAPSHRRVSTRW